jgi:hypothetical protein
MSLNYDIQKVPTKVKRILVEPEMKFPGFMTWKKNGKPYAMNPLTEKLIFATMSVGMGSINEQNASEFLARLIWVDRVSGTPRTEVTYWDKKKKKWAHRKMVLKDILDHVGLFTNVSDEPLKSWMKRLGELYYKEIHREVK